MSFPLISIGLIHFPTCGAEHFRTALTSLFAQEFEDPLTGWANVREIVVYDNNSGTYVDTLARTVDSVCKSLAVQPEVRGKLRFVFDYHHDASKTHPYSLNATLAELRGPALFITRSDYVLHPQILTKLAAAARQATVAGLLPFVSAHCYQSAYDRQEQPYPPFAVTPSMTWADLLKAPGYVFHETDQDAGVWLSFTHVLGSCRLNEQLTAWGYAQSTWQRELKAQGAEMIAVPEVLFFHQQHGDWVRDHALARQQYEQFGGGR